VLVGQPYLRASDIGVVVASIPDEGLRAKIRPKVSAEEPIGTSGSECAKRGRELAPSPIEASLSKTRNRAEMTIRSGGVWRGIARLNSGSKMGAHEGVNKNRYGESP